MVVIFQLPGFVYFASYIFKLSPCTPHLEQLANKPAALDQFLGELVKRMAMYVINHSAYVKILETHI